MNADKSPADEVTIGGGAKGNMTPLPFGFEPSNADVLCGRGKKNYNSLGNQRLRRIVDSYVEQYSAATSRQDKSDILSAIVNDVRQASPHGGFIKQDPATERWFEVGAYFEFLGEAIAGILCATTILTLTIIYLDYACRSATFWHVKRCHR